MQETYDLGCQELVLRRAFHKWQQSSVFVRCDQELLTQACPAHLQPEFRVRRFFKMPDSISTTGFPESFCLGCRVCARSLPATRTHPSHHAAGSNGRVRVFISRAHLARQVVGLPFVQTDLPSFRSLSFGLSCSISSWMLGTRFVLSSCA